MRHRAAVLGSPVSHSLSPVIHAAGYRAAGLSGWAYTAVECGVPDLAGFVHSRDDRWAGLSLTMPLKEAAPQLAGGCSPLVAALGAANTLVRRGTADPSPASGGGPAEQPSAPGGGPAEQPSAPGGGPAEQPSAPEGARAEQPSAPAGGPAEQPGAARARGGGWYAENTDAPGMVDALAARGVAAAGTVAVLGAGGTARAALGAAARLGATRVIVYARRPDAVLRLGPVADRLGVRLQVGPWADASRCGAADVVISTVPAGAADALAREVAWPAGTALLDSVYHPWPTPLAAAAGRSGAPVASGLDLLLAQAVRQFELFTGVAPAPSEAMGAALRAAVAAGRP